MIVFRVDANEQVATGHLMRTLSIASACRKCGLTCEFWLAEEKETERIAKAGFPYRILETRWDALEDELPVMKQRLQACLLYTSPSPRDRQKSRMPSSA